MKNFIKKTIIYFFSLVIIIFVNQNVLALGNLDSIPVANDETKKVLDIGSSAGYATDSTATSILSRVVQLVIGLSGTVAVGLVIWSGFKYLLSKGKPDEIKKALSLMTTGFIGIVLMTSAYAISSYVIKQTQKIAGFASPNVVPEENAINNSASLDQINLCASKTTESDCSSAGCIFTNIGCLAERSIGDGAICPNDNSNLCISKYCSGETNNKVCLTKFSKANSSSCFSPDDCLSRYCAERNGNKICLDDPSSSLASACAYSNYYDFSNTTFEALKVQDTNLCQEGYSYDRNLISILFGGNTSNCKAKIPAKDRLIAISYNCYNASERYDCRLCVSDRCNTNTSELFCKAAPTKCKWVEGVCERLECSNITKIEDCSNLTRCNWVGSKCIEK